MQYQLKFYEFFANDVFKIILSAQDNKLCKNFL
jgi:hypothetical protein